MDHVGIENGSAAALPPSVPSSSPLSRTLPEVLADRATGGSLTVAQATMFVESQTGTRVHRATLWRWILTQRLASFRVGGKVRTTKGAVLAMLASDAERGAVRARQADARRAAVEAAGAEALARIEGMGGA